MSKHDVSLLTLTVRLGCLSLSCAAFRASPRHQRIKPLHLSSATSILPGELDTDAGNKEEKASPLSMNLDELTTNLRGKGKAQAVWDCFKLGIDPLWFHHPAYPAQHLDSAVHQLGEDGGDEDDRGGSRSSTTSRERIQQHLPIRRRSQALGRTSLQRLSDSYPSPLGIEPSLASLDQITRSADGTTKLLLKLAGTEFLVETVIIPHPEWNKSTLCVSNQVGCAQGCVFCATGKMGRLASLTADQILIQLYYANKVCRVADDENSLPQIDNIVFMGMGEAGDNVEAVRQAVDVMTDRSCFGLARSKITISTVGPNPEAFSELARADAVLAWSVHAVRDDLRKRLVPTTRHTMKELGDGVVRALAGRSKKLRQLMMEVTLLDGVNDGVQEAEDMAAYALDLMDRVEGMKLTVNLIPFNDIGYEQYRRASNENVAEFQRILVDAGVRAYIRTTRGDEEGSACGQLATKKRRQRIARDTGGADENTENVVAP